MFERLRAAINAALDAATPPPDSREVLSLMRDAVIAARVSIEKMREGVAATQQALDRERKQLADAERRGRLAQGIQDSETVDVAERFAAKHRERVEVLDEKLDAQRAELELAERELGDMKAKLKEVERSRPATEASQQAAAAWRELEAAGGSRRETTDRSDTLRSDLDRAAREAQAEAQLRELKKRMGKQ